MDTTGTPAIELGVSSRVAVVVVSRNRGRQLCETLTRHLSLPERPRVVLVDDVTGPRFSVHPE